MITTFDDLASLRLRHKDKKIVFCSGSFDLTHAGHALFFEDCKKLGDILVVMIGNDEAIRRAKGRSRPVLNEYVRAKTVDMMKPVDYAFIDWIIDDADYYFAFLKMALKTLQPDIYAINDDAKNIPAREEFTKALGIQLTIMPRNCPPEFESISTTNIIEKIRRS